MMDESQKKNFLPVEMSARDFGEEKTPGIIISVTAIRYAGTIEQNFLPKLYLQIYNHQIFVIKLRISEGILNMKARYHFKYTF